MGDFEGSVEINTRRRDIAYVATYPYSDANVQKFSWLFMLGRLDTWVTEPQTPSQYNAVQHYRRPNIGIQNIRLSAPALDMDVDDEPGVKFLFVTQEKDGLQTFKLTVSDSKPAAGIDMYYELLQGHSIVFVGAVLKDAPVPMMSRYPAFEFKRVGSAEEAENLAEGVVGVIC